MREENLEKAERNCNASSGVGCDGFHPEVPSELSRTMTEKL